MARLHKSHALAGIAIAIASTICFFGALAFPAVGTCPAPTSMIPNWFDNSNILFFGWMAAVFGQFGWFANIPFFVSAVLLIRGRCPPSVLPILQAVFVLMAVVTLQRSLGMRLPHNEGYEEPVCWLGAGFWLWVAAQSMMCLAALAARHTPSKPDNM